MSKTYHISLEGSGGEYCLGTVTDKPLFEVMKKLYAKDELYLYTDTELGEIPFFEYQDIVACWGPVDGSVRSSIDLIKEDDTENIELKYEDIPTLIYSNPYLSSKEIDENIEKGILGYFGGASIEKGHFDTFELVLDDEFDINNLYYLAINLDETLCCDEVITDIMYITKEQMREIVKKHSDIILDDYEDDDEVLEYFRDIVSEDNDLSIVEEYLLDRIGDSCTTGKSSFIDLCDENFVEYDKEKLNENI